MVDKIKWWLEHNWQGVIAGLIIGFLIAIAF